jgi:hypothetical protein
MAPSFRWNECNCLHHPPPPVAAAATIRLFIPLETAVLLNSITISRKSCPTVCSCPCSRDELCCRPQPQAPPAGPPPTSQAAAFHSLPPSPLPQLPSTPPRLLPSCPFLTFARRPSAACWRPRRCRAAVPRTRLGAPSRLSHPAFCSGVVLFLFAAFVLT